MCVIFFIFVTFFLPYNIDHSTKNVCSGIFRLKHTIALFVKVESDKNGERTNMQQESVDINIGILIPTTTDIRLLTYRGMRFCCISSLAAAAADDCPTIWQPLFPPDGIPSYNLHTLLPTLLAMHLQWAEGTITDPSRYLVKTWTHSAWAVFFLLMR